VRGLSLPTTPPMPAGGRSTGCPRWRMTTATSPLMPSRCSAPATGPRGTNEDHTHDSAAAVVIRAASPCPRRVRRRQLCVQRGRSEAVLRRGARSAGQRALHGRGRPGRTRGADRRRGAVKRIVQYVGYAIAGVVLAGGAVWISDGDTAAAPFSQTNGVADVDQARDQLASLEVRPEHATDGYDRDDWPHWMPVGEGCDAREWVLREHAEDMVRTKGACTIGNGRWTSSYDGEVVTDPSELDIDHLVPLAEAH